ncbi:MAG: PIG-L family deacetylase [Chitinophagaceae bacterium]
MKTFFISSAIALTLIGTQTPTQQATAQTTAIPLRIIAFGAHPDDVEQKTGGMGAIWAAQGYKVKFVALTNGDVGHFESSGGALANRRLKEVQECAKIFGVETEVLDIHDGELEPTLENRKKVARLIREWQADIVLCHRPYDYHPDHRYVGVLVQDASVIVAAPFFTPDTPPTKGNPVFMYYSDNFLRPYAFDPTIVIGIDEVADKKWSCITAMPSQFGDEHSWQASTFPNVPKDEQGRKDYLMKSVQLRNEGVASKYRDRLIELYGKEKGSKIKYAEAFELCQYGRQASIDELKKLFLLKVSTTNQPGVVSARQDGVLLLSAEVGRAVGPKIKYMPDESAFGWFTAADKVEWNVQVARAGEYDVYLDWSVPNPEAGKPFILEAGGQALKGTVEETGSWQTYKTGKIGVVKLKEGNQKLVFRPASKFETVGDKGALLDLRGLKLIPK